MANDLDNPGVLILDTAAVIHATKLFRLRKVQFIGALAGDDAIFEDGEGREIMHLSAPAANAPDSVSFNPPLQVFGLELASIAAGGVCHVYAW